MSTFGGRQGYPGANQNLLKHQEEQSDQAAWPTQEAILTPGDKYEVKIKVVAGDSIMAGVTSDAFDPALEIDSPDGKILAKNDDRADGDQAPFLTYHFTSDGEYSVKILSFRSVAGGKFALKLRKFHPFDATLDISGKVTPTTNADLGGRLVLRLPVEKDKIYDLHRVGVWVKDYFSQYHYRFIIGQSGVPGKDYSLIPTSTGQELIKARTTGDLYVEYDNYTSEPWQTQVDTVEVVTVKADDSQIVGLNPWEAKIVQYAVKRNYPVRTTLTPGSYGQLALGPIQDSQTFSRLDPNQSGGDQRTYGYGISHVWFRAKADSDADVLRFYASDGNAMVVLRSETPRPQKLTVTNTTKLPEWTNAKDEKGSIEIGESKFLWLTSGKSELMRVKSSAEHFEPVIDILNLNGAIENTLIDRAQHQPGDDLYFPEARSFVVRVHCDGHGGSGNYTLHRDFLTPKQLSLNTVTTANLTADGISLFAINLEGGKRYEIVSMADASTVDLLDDDGNFQNCSSMVFDDTLVRYFTPPHGGRYRIWIRGATPAFQFRLSPHTKPTVKL